MDKIKCIFILLVLFVTLTLFSGCVVIPMHKQYNDINVNSVASVEIYDLRKSVTNYNTFLKTESPVYTINDDQTENFFDDLGDIRFTDHIIIVLAAVDPSFHYGDWVVRINYNDGTFCLISCAGYGETYNSNNEVIDSNHYSCDDEEWEQFIKKYIPQETYNN